MLLGPYSSDCCVADSDYNPSASDLQHILIRQLAMIFLDVMGRRFLKTTLGAACVTAIGAAAVLSVKKTKIVKKPVYDLDRLGKIDPSLIQYKQYIKPISTSFSGSRSITIGSQGLIYIAGDKSVRVFNQGGGPLAKLARISAELCQLDTRGIR